MKLTKAVTKYGNGIICTRMTPKPIVLCSILSDGSLLPCEGQDIYLHELKQITAIAENFHLFFNNLPNVA